MQAVNRVAKGSSRIHIDVFLRTYPLWVPALARRGEWKTMKKATAPGFALATLLMISGMIAVPVFGKLPPLRTN